MPGSESVAGKCEWNGNFIRILHRDVLALSILQFYSPTESDFNQHFALWAFKYAGLDLSYLASNSVFSRTACAMVSASWYFFLLLLSSFTESCSSAWIAVSCSMHCGAKHRRTHKTFMQMIYPPRKACKCSIKMHKKTAEYVWHAENMETSPQRRGQTRAALWGVSSETESGSSNVSEQKDQEATWGLSRSVTLQPGLLQQAINQLIPLQIKGSLIIPICII